MSTHRLLFADDDEKAHRLVEMLCQKKSIAIEHAYSGEEAVALLGSNPPQLYLLDVKMPGPSGIELAEIIMEKADCPAIMILTGHAELNDAVRAAHKGIFDYLAKEEMNAQQLLDLFDRAIDYHNTLKRTTQSQNAREQDIQNVQYANQRFQIILDMSDELIFVLDAETFHLLDYNAAALNHLGFDRSQLINQPFETICAQPKEAIWTEIVRGVREHRPTLIETELIRQNRSRIPVEISFSIAAMVDGQYVSVVARDIRERKQNEERLRQSKKTFEIQARKLRTILDSMEQSVVVVNRDGLIEDVNAECERLFKMPKELLLQSDAESVFNQIEGFAVDAHLKAYQQGTNFTPEEVGVANKQSHYRIQLHPFFHGEEFMGLVVILNDMTEWVARSNQEKDDLKRQSNNMKDQMSDWKIPLKGVQDLANSLKNTDLSADQQIIADTIVQLLDSFDGSKIEF